ncbi:MAG: ABC transporter permease [Desulfarculaceae bacterium]|nr:ABC transporter permease [Desulfarculaceae bacterium]MCF8071173.1 ABC transporter permease [Desulfarculaceae bacterium]MCF8101224.1 ABC transporter permease [Desulfarculaceae bacterium]MCF8115227.1 ABC transporter permease [Desulfarculaceae bacterium]
MAYVINGLTFAMMLFVLSAGLNIILGFLGVLNFAHGALFILGAYVTYAVTQTLGDFWLGLLIAPLVVGLFGMLIEFVFLRPLYKRHHVYTILLTFGLILVIYDIIKIIWGSDVKTVVTPPLLSGSFTLFGEIIPVASVFIILVGVLTAGGLWFIFKKTTFGKILTAISLDREIANALGFNVARRGTLAFGLGALLAGLAGVLGSLKLSIAAGVDAEFLIYSFAIVVIGGVGSFRGTLLASLIVGEMSVLGGVFLPELSMSLIFVLLVVFLTLYPRGMFGREIEQMHVPVVPYLGNVATAFQRLSATQLSLLSSLLVVALLVVAPLALPKYWTYLLAEIMVFALFAISFNVLFGFTGMLSFGQASIFGAGAYTISLMLIHVTGNWWLAFAASLVISTGVAVIIGLMSIHRSEIYFGMLTMAFAMLFYSIIYKWNSLTGGADGLSGIPSPVLKFGFTEVEILTPLANYYFILVVVAICYFILRTIMNSPFGQVLLAIRENPTRTEFLGLPVKKYKFIAFVIAGVFTGVAGALFAPFAGTIDALASHWSKSGEPIFMSLIGGISTLIGPGVGTLFYYVLHSYIVSITEYWQLVMGSILITVVMLFPMGITGYAKKFILSFKSS